MMVIFEIRAKLTELYQKYDYPIRLILKLILLVFTFSKIKAAVGFNASLSKTVLIWALALVGAFLPSSLMVLMVVAYLVLQIWSGSSLLALMVLFICLILYCFFLRFTPKEGAVVFALPVLRAFGFPYVLPLSLGMFGSLLSIIPTCCGVVGYYLVHIVKDNAQLISQTMGTGFSISGADNPLVMYMDVLDKLIKNPAMYVTMFIYAAVIVTVYFVKSLNMDYAFEISIGVGSGVMMLGYIIASLKYEMGISLISVLFGIVISAVLVYVFLFFYRVLSYSAAEHVQFEDDDYYYYVKAVPKIRVGVPKKKIKKINMQQLRRQHEEDEEDMEDEAIEAVEQSLMFEQEDAKPAADNASQTYSTAPEVFEDEDEDYQ